MKQDASLETVNTTRQRMAEMLRGDPAMGTAEMAAALGVSRQRVYQLLPEFELPPGVVRRKPIPALPASPKPHDQRLRPNRGPRLSSIVTATICEMQAAIDLMSREIDVFKAVAFVAKFDLIARCRKTGRLVAIDVKTAWRSKRGFLNYPTRPEGVAADGEHYALVFRSGEVMYIPPLPEGFGCSPPLQRRT